MWEAKNTSIRPTFCVSHHPYYGNARILLMENNEPLFLFTQMPGMGQKYVILDELPAHQITAKLSESNHTKKLQQIDANTFIEKDDLYVLINGKLRTDGIYGEPYCRLFNGTRIGNRYWKGSVNIDWLNHAGGTQTFTLNEVEGDTTATITVTNPSFGWWEQQSSAPSLCDIYLGKGKYEGQYRFIGTPTWKSPDKKIKINAAYDSTVGNIAPKGLSYNEDTAAYIIGTYGSPSGWHEIPDSALVLGDTVTAIGRNIEGATTPSDITLSWDGCQDLRTDYQRVWVADTPAWR